MSAAADDEWFAELGATMGEHLAQHPEVTPADMGARMARIMGEELGADPERIDAAEAGARVRFGAIDRSTLIGMAAESVGRDRRGWADDNA